MKLWKIFISGKEWRGGDYNGSYYGFIHEKFFSTKEKAEKFIKQYKQPLYESPHELSGPYLDETSID